VGKSLPRGFESLLLRRGVGSVGVKVLSVRESAAVCEGLRRFYTAFSSHDPDEFASAIADCPGVSVVGSAPEEGHADRDSWVATYSGLVSTLPLRRRG
jgi:hypothetical protein